MAKSLLETLKTSEAKGPQIGMGPQQEQAQKVLTTKATGLAAQPGAGPAASSQAAKLGLQAGQQQMEKQALTGRLQDVEVLERAKSQEAGAQRQESQFKHGIKKMKRQFQMQANNMLEDIARQREQLSEEDFKNKMENASQQLRLSNRQYIDSLERAGRESRLTDKLEADEAYARTALGNSLDFLKDDLAYKKFMGADDRAFSEEMANMDINHAMQMAEQSIKAEQEANKYQAIGGMFSAGIQAYGAYKGGQDKKSDFLAIHGEEAFKKRYPDEDPGDYT